MRDGETTNREARMLKETKRRLAAPTFRRRLRKATKDLRDKLDLPELRETLEDPEARQALRRYLMET